MNLVTAIKLYLINNSLTKTAQKTLLEKNEPEKELMFFFLFDLSGLRFYPTS